MSLRRWKAPDGSIRIECVACQGGGGADVTHPSGDPQLDTFVNCGDCHGYGYWEVECDVLIRMARARRTGPWSNTCYTRLRSEAMRPVRLPSDHCADPLFQQAQRDCDAAIRNFAPMAALFDAIASRQAA